MENTSGHGDNNTQYEVSEDVVEIRGICVVCSSPAGKSCSGCQSTNRNFGRHLVAARTLKPGTLILEETPISCAPRGLVEDYESPVCLTCCSLMDEESAQYRCSKCKWPTCSWNCEQNKLHADNECKIFSKNKVSFPPAGESYPVYIAYKVIEILRGLVLKEEDPETWSKIMDLQWETDLGNEKEMFKDLTKLRKTFGVDEIGTEEDWRRILGVLNVNNFSVEGRRGGAEPSFTSFIYLKSSMLTHSCAPNCRWGVSVFPKYNIEVRPTVEIQKGEILTIPYTFIYNSFGTHKRQELIQDDWEFICKCDRCLDPTELGSFASALICSSCKKGNVLPTNPVDLESDWKCQDCPQIESVASINKRLEGLMGELESCKLLPDMEKFVLDNQGKTIHPNHWLITEAEEVMCNERTRSVFVKDEMTLEEREKHISLCEHLLKVKNLIAPGQSLERARLLNHLARGRFEKLDIVVRKKLLTDEEEISAEADLICFLYEGALQFYSTDKTEVPTGELHSLKCRTIMFDMRLVKELFNAKSGETSSEDETLFSNLPD